MFRLTRPMSILMKSTYKSSTNMTAALISIHKYRFSGGHASAADINHPHLGSPCPGEDPSANNADNPFLWDPHYQPQEESDYDRHMQDMPVGSKYAIEGDDEYASTTRLERSDVLSRISKIVGTMERAKTDGKAVSFNTHLYNDLGLDSLDQVEFGLALEDEFELEIPDEEAEQIVTVGDACDLICDHVNAM
eukprot:383599_1